MKIKYIGDFKDARVKLSFTNSLEHLNRGDIIELEDALALKLMKENKDFVKVDGGKATTESKAEPVTKKWRDLNDDGVIDKADASLAAKTLSSFKK
jgi:hypothetical protein